MGAGPADIIKLTALIDDERLGMMVMGVKGVGSPYVLPYRCVYFP